MSKTHGSESSTCNNNGEPSPPPQSPSGNNGIAPDTRTESERAPGDPSPETPGNEGSVKKAVGSNPSPRVTSPSPTGSGPRSSSGPSNRTRIFTPSKRSASLTSGQQLGLTPAKTDLLVKSPTSPNRSNSRPPGVPLPVHRRRSTPIVDFHKGGSREREDGKADLKGPITQTQQGISRGGKATSGNSNSNPNQTSFTNQNSRGSNPRAR